MHCESIYLKNQSFSPLLIRFQVTPLVPVSERQLLLFVPYLIIELLVFYLTWTYLDIKSHRFCSEL